MTRRFLPALFYVLIYCCASAQEKTIALKRLSSQQGLSDNQVTCTLRDKLGFIWIGTKDGLNRYDGKDFYVFKHNNSDSNSVCGNIISCLEVDNDSMLWVGTASSGMCSYDFRTGKFKGYNKSNSELVTNNINDIAFDKGRNCLWIALNNGGLQIFDLETKGIDAKQKVVSNNTYYDVQLKDTIPYFAGIIESLKRLGNIGKFRTPVSDTAQTINKILLAGDGNLWCGAWDNGLHRFDESGKRKGTYFFDGSNKLKQSGDEIISLAEDANKVIWCGTKTSGIHFFDCKSNSFTGDIKLSIAVTARINNLYRDNQNRMWIATEAGLYVYDPLQNQFETVHLPVPPGYISCKTNDRLITNGGREYVVTQCGLFYKDSSDENYLHKEFIYHNEKLELTSIYEDKANVIYIGTNRTIFALDTLKIQLKEIETHKELKKNKKIFFIGASRVNSIISIVHNNSPLIAASFYGHNVVLIDTVRNNVFIVLRDTNGNNNYIDNLSRKILTDSKNNFWICGATFGVSKLLIPEAVDFNNYPLADSVTNIIYASAKTWNVSQVNNAFDMVENSDGSFWVSTQGHGLLKFFPGNDSLNFISYSGNIKSTQGIAKDNDNNVWLITSSGLLHYNVSHSRFKLFNAESGITETISGYFFANNKTTAGDFMSAGFDGGFVSFHPSEIISNKEKPVVSITRLWIMDAPSDSLLFGKLQLNYNQNFLKFNIAANSFSDNGQTTYLYLLDGIDNDWHNNQTNPLITYTNLPAGNFTLKVKALNSDGVESNVYEIPIIISPPFYNTYWFYILVMMTIAASVYVFYRYRIRQLLKLQEVRNKIARDLHDDIGSTLGSIHLYSQIANAKLNGEHSPDVKSILERIENSSSEIIDKTGDVVWAVKASNDTLKNLIMRMESYAASLLGAAEIQFNIDFDERIANMKLEMAERKNIFLIYKEAIHNIIKYAACTEVNISVKKAGDKLQIKIADNGKGFSTDVINAYNGNGIKNMKYRAEEIKGNCKVVSQPGTGTSIEISV